MAYQTINPYTNQVVKEYPNATAEEIEAALAAANDLYHQWKREDLATRQAQLHEIATLMRQNRDELAKTMTQDMGKLLREAQGEVELCAMIADYFADHSAELLQPQVLETTANRACTN